MFLDFVVKHWEVLLIICFLFLDLVLLIFKKKPGFNILSEIKEDILTRLPILISVVEKPGSGSEKLEMVLSMVESYIKEKYGFNNFNEIRFWCISRIESILSTPQKKEV